MANTIFPTLVELLSFFRDATLVIELIELLCKLRRSISYTKTKIILTMLVSKVASKLPLLF